MPKNSRFEKILDSLVPRPNPSSDQQWGSEPDYENFRPIDVQVWSDYPEINELVRVVYERFFGDRKAHIAKKHIKVVLLDLYVRWMEDPDGMLTVPCNSNEYRAFSRYNSLHISRKTIDVVTCFHEVGLVYCKKGFLDRAKNIGRTTRIWPTRQLVDLFSEARLELFRISYPNDKEVIILNDGTAGKKRLLEYTEVPETEAMRAAVRRYNKLLRKTFVDIPGLEKTVWKGSSRVCITHLNKFVYRVFNRGSFQYSGRFYGGWWMACQKKLRSQIFINDKPTNELDYSGLHVVMLYAMEGLTYWSLGRGDPYSVPVLDFQNEKDARSDIKKMLLVLLNAKSKVSAFKAFRNEADSGSPQKRYSDRQLGQLLQLILDKHPEIAKYFASDVGTRLMNLDSNITAKIIERFCDLDVPVLTVHDSYIVPCGWEEDLRHAMLSAFQQVMGQPLENQCVGQAITEVSSRVEDLEAPLNTWMPYPEVMSYQMCHQEIYLKRVRPTKSLRYIKNFDIFNSINGQ